VKRLIVDLDGTLALPSSDHNHSDKYASAIPNTLLIAKLWECRAAGFEIVIHTARNMRTYAGAIGKINVHTLPVILDWLRVHNVPYDEVVLGKPWCGDDGFYIDDRAIRPAEFIQMSTDEALRLLNSQ